jgi:hypothetical protein
LENPTFWSGISGGAENGGRFYLGKFEETDQLALDAIGSQAIIGHPTWRVCQTDIEESTPKCPTARLIHEDLLL